MSRSRRQFLGFLGIGVGTALGGCAGGSDSPAESASTQRGTDTPTDESGTTTDGPESTTDKQEPTTEDPDPTMSTVFHFSKGVSEQNHAVANVANLLADETVDLESVVLVANGRGILLLTTDDSDLVDEVASLIDDGVSFRVCENSMEKLDVGESDLVDGVETVPSGVGELTKLQVRDDFAYIETP
ncbi:MAG: DsrE family protein [Halobacteriota archaeon]